MIIYQKKEPFSIAGRFLNAAPTSAKTTGNCRVRYADRLWTMNFAGGPTIAFGFQR